MLLIALQKSAIKHVLYSVFTFIYIYIKKNQNADIFEWLSIEKDAWCHFYIHGSFMRLELCYKYILKNKIIKKVFLTQKSFTLSVHLWIVKPFKSQTGRLHPPSTQANQMAATLCWPIISHSSLNQLHSKYFLIANIIFLNSIDYWETPIYLCILFIVNLLIFVWIF